jgi:hypothetical protein
VTGPRMGNAEFRGQTGDSAVRERWEIQSGHPTDDTVAHVSLSSSALGPQPGRGAGSLRSAEQTSSVVRVIPQPCLPVGNSPTPQGPCAP